MRNYFKSRFFLTKVLPVLIFGLWSIGYIYGYFLEKIKIEDSILPIIITIFLFLNMHFRKYWLSYILGCIFILSSIYFAMALLSEYYKFSDLSSFEALQLLFVGLFICLSGITLGILMLIPFGTIEKFKPNKRIISFFIHFPVWIIAFLFSYFFGTEKYPGGTSYQYFFTTVMYLVWSLGTFYCFYTFLVPKYLENGKIRLFCLFSGLYVIIIPLLLILYSFVFHLNPIPVSEYLSHLAFRVLVFWMIFTLLCGILGCLYRFSTDWFNNLYLKKEIENIQLRSELKAIKSRLNPHFLFNTLNNIDALIQSNPEKASEVLSKLSDLFRYVVYETENEKTAIKKELEMIGKYVDLEKIRLSNPDAVSYDNSVDNDFLFPPMILIPFVENAFKHCNMNDHNNRIAISVSDNTNELLFRCINSIHKRENDSKDKGIGLQLIKERLNLLFPNNHNLHIAENDNEFDVTLKINLFND